LDAYRSPGPGSALNNFKNKYQNFRKIYFSKNYYLYSEKENHGKIFTKYGISQRRIFQK
jgi:hypothetical protein